MLAPPPPSAGVPSLPHFYPQFFCDSFYYLFALCLGAKVPILSSPQSITRLDTQSVIAPDLDTATRVPTFTTKELAQFAQGNNPKVPGYAGHTFSSTNSSEFFTRVTGANLEKALFIFRVVVFCFSLLE